MIQLAADTDLDILHEKILLQKTIKEESLSANFWKQIHLEATSLAHKCGYSIGDQTPFGVIKNILASVSLYHPYVDWKGVLLITDKGVDIVLPFRHIERVLDV